MNVQKSFRDHNLGKRIPLHYQKRYLANISNGSFNATGVYKSRINALLKNNKVLAIALQNDRAKKEELLEENKSNANIIMYSRLKIGSLSDDLKKVVTVLDETLSLLQMHSSVSSSKFTPRNTIRREEFKEQVKEVYMDSIPEEPESPHRTLNNTNIKEMDGLNKKLSEPVHEDIHPENQVKKSDKKNLPLQKQKKSMKNTKHTIFSKKPSMQDTNKIRMNPMNESCQLSASVYNYDEKSPARAVSTRFKKKLSNENKNSTSEVCYEKVITKKRPKTATNPKSGKFTKTAVLDNAKKEGCCNEVNNSPSKSNLYQGKLCSDIQILDVVPIIENKNYAKIDHKNLNVSRMLNGVSPSKLHSNIANDTYVISECEKENENSNKRQKMSLKKFEAIGEVDLELTKKTRKGTRITSSCYSPLKDFSSKINIENFKGNIPKIDDLITIRQKSARLNYPNEGIESCDTSRSYLQDLSLHQQEMVRNLAENTLLVTAEVHKSAEPIKTDKLKIPDAKYSFSKQPIVLVKDIFHSGKSFCKSISRPACNKLIGNSLELQLLEHCSSLKVIPEESLESQNSSTSNCSDDTKRKVPKVKIKNIEPPLSIEGEYTKETLEEKRLFRKRSVGLNYKEPRANIKLRR